MSGVRDYMNNGNMKKDKGRRLDKPFFKYLFLGNLIYDKINL